MTTFDSFYTMCTLVHGRHMFAIGFRISQVQVSSVTVIKSYLSVKLQINVYWIISTCSISQMIKIIFELLCDDLIGIF